MLRREWEREQRGASGEEKEGKGEGREREGGREKNLKIHLRFVTGVMEQNSARLLTLQINLRNRTPHPQPGDQNTPFLGVVDEENGGNISLPLERLLRHDLHVQDGGSRLVHHSFPPSLGFRRARGRERDRRVLDRVRRQQARLVWGHMNDNVPILAVDAELALLRRLHAEHAIPLQADGDGGLTQPPGNRGHELGAVVDENRWDVWGVGEDEGHHAPVAGLQLQVLGDALGTVVERMGGVRNAEEDFVRPVKEQAVRHQPHGSLHVGHLALAQYQPVEAVLVHGENQSGREGLLVRPQRRGREEGRDVGKLRGVELDTVLRRGEKVVE